MGTQERYVLGVLVWDGMRAACWEFGRAVAKQLAELGATERTMRGMCLEIWRADSAARGRIMVAENAEVYAHVRVRYGSSEELATALPAGPDVQGTLVRWWRSQGWHT